MILRLPLSTVAFALSLSLAKAANVFAAVCSNSRSEPRVAALLARLESLGYQARFLDCSDALYDGKFHFGIRMKHYQRFVESLSGDPLVILIDGFDVLAEGPATEAESKFKQFGASLVVQCVTYPWPPPSSCPIYDQVPPPLPYPSVYSSCSYACGGGLMGYRSAFAKLYAEHPYEADTDDQCWLQRVLRFEKANDTDWRLDAIGHLFLSETRICREPYRQVDGRAVLSVEGLSSRPVFIHLDSAHPTVEQMAELRGGNFNGVWPQGTCWTGVWDFWIEFAKLLFAAIAGAVIASVVCCVRRHRSASAGRDSERSDEEKDNLLH